MEGETAQTGEPHPLRTVFLVLIIVVSTSLGDVLITRGLRRVGEVTWASARSVFAYGKKLFATVAFQGGVFFIALSFIAFMIVLSWADLSYVVPATSISYVLTTLGARFYLKENISPLRWAGTVFVCLGVALISLP